MVDEGSDTTDCHTLIRGSKNLNFKYTEPFINHFKFCHQVDDHNNNRHFLISLEESINTKDRKIRVFTFILAVI